MPSTRSLSRQLKEVEVDSLTRSTRNRKQPQRLGNNTDNKSDIRKNAEESEHEDSHEEALEESEQDVEAHSSDESSEEEHKRPIKTKIVEKRVTRQSNKRKIETDEEAESSSSEEEEEEEEESESESDEPSDTKESFLIETILGRRIAVAKDISSSDDSSQDDKKVEKKDNLAGYEFLVKERGRAYLHADWFTTKYIKEHFSNGVTQLKKYMREEVEDDSNQSEGKESGEESPFKEQYYFSSDYLVVDRIVDSEGSANKKTKNLDTEEDEQLLVKWKSLGYDECTWESKKELLNRVPNAAEKILYYRSINSKEALDRAKKARPSRPKPNSVKTEKLKVPYKDLSSDAEDESSEEENSDSQDAQSDSKMDVDNEPKQKALRLKDYQEEGFKWLVHCWLNRRNSILADEMGLGKTIQTAVLLQYLYRTQKINGPFLIIAPMSTIEQWKRELEMWTGMNVIIFHGSADARELIYEKEWFFENTRVRDKIYKFQAMITTFEVALNEATKLKSVPWQYMVIDEGHRIKNHKSKLFSVLSSYKSNHKLLLTGTPLQNGMLELWTLMNFLEPTKFADSEKFMSEFGDLKDASQVEKLHKKLGPYMLRRTKEDVDTNIPNKEETLVEVELTSIQKTYYRAIFDRNRDFLTRNAAKASLMNVMMQLRKVCNHPYLIRDAEDSIAKDIYKTIKNKKERQEALFKRFTDSSSKFQFMDKLLARLRAANQRVLIFSQMVKMLDLLEDYMKYKGYPFERLDGGVKRTERQAAIDRFSNQNIDCFVFLLGTRAGGLGINLTVASNVIIFDSDWNPQNDLQAQARCHRIGQVSTVKVYRLITKNTYEKHMFQVASKKLGLDQVVLGKKVDDDQEGEGLVNGLSKEEIEKVLKFGAYAVFSEDSNNGQNEEMDIDSILSQASTIAYQRSKDQIQNSLSSFSKATFKAEGEEDRVDWNDAQFWEKLLPSYKTSNRIRDIIKNNIDELDNEETRKQIIHDFEGLMKDVKDREENKSMLSSFDPTGEVLHLLKKLLSVAAHKFSAEEMSSLNGWAKELDRPKLRTRGTRQQPQTEGKRGRKESDSDSSSDESSQSEQEESEEASQPKKKSKKKEVPEVKTVQWAKAQRDRLKQAMLLFGYGRWDKISENANLRGKSQEEIQCFAEAIVKKLFDKVVEIDELKIKESFCTRIVRALDHDNMKLAALKDFKSEDFCTLTLINPKDVFAPCDIIQLKVVLQENQNIEGARIAIFYQAEKERLVRLIEVSDISKVIEISCPGFEGDYRLQVVKTASSQKVLSTSLSFKVGSHPLLAEMESSEKQVKTWAKQLHALRWLKKIYERDGNFEEASNFRKNAPSSWWTADDDVKLLKGLWNFGWGKIDQCLDDKEYGWSTDKYTQLIDEEMKGFKEVIKRQNLKSEEEEELLTKRKAELERKHAFPTNVKLNSRIYDIISFLVKGEETPTQKKERLKKNKEENEKKQKENEKKQKEKSNKVTKSVEKRSKPAEKPTTNAKPVETNDVTPKKEYAPVVLVREKIKKEEKLLQLSPKQDKKDKSSPSPKRQKKSKEEENKENKPIKNTISKYFAKVN